MVLALTTALAEVRGPSSVSRGPANHGHVRFALAGFAPQGLQSGLAATITTPSRGRAREGQQNKLGNYHCNNRVYSIQAGRWLSPDQARSPYWNLNGYVLRQMQVSDPTGLKVVIGTGRAQDNAKGRNYRKEMFEALKRICPDDGITMNERTGEISVPDDFCRLAMACTNGPVNRGRPGQKGHEKGCALLRCVICSDHTVKIDHPDTTQNRYVPDSETKTRKKLKKGGDPMNKDDYENSSGGGGTVHVEGLGGNGTTGKTWHGEGDKPQEITPSLPRILAHELAHACFGVQGAEKQFNPDSGCKGTNPWKRNDRWMDDDEYDADTDWANPIAKEIADDPKTRSNTNGKDTESGVARGGHD